VARIFLIRHGETVHNRDRILQGPRIDSELSERGQLQARHVAQALAKQPLSALFSSPLRRARDTAQAVASIPGRELVVQVVPELYEVDYGTLAGRTYDEVRPEFEQVVDAWRMGFPDVSFPGGESAVVAQHRVRPFVERVVARARAGETAAVVAHGRINRVLAATITGQGLGKLEEFPQSNGAITELAVDGMQVQVVRLNDVEHLDVRTEAFS